MWNLDTSPRNGHVFSELGDALAFGLPLALSFVAMPFLYAFVAEDAIPLWAYVAVVALTDVGHVWATLFRCYLDAAENRRRPVLYNVAPVALFAAAFALHFFVSEACFWTLLGYLAIYHFVRQQFGFLMIAKGRDRDASNFGRDSALLYAGAAFPIALWHLDRSRRFDWFNRDDPFLHATVAQGLGAALTTVFAGFGVGGGGSSSSSSSAAPASSSSSLLPLGRWSSRLSSAMAETVDMTTPMADDSSATVVQLIVTVLYGLGAAVMLAVVATERLAANNRRRGAHRDGESPQPPSSSSLSSSSPQFLAKHMLLIGTWVTWAFGVLCPHRVVALTFLNLFHAFPAFLVVFCTAFNRWWLLIRSGGGGGGGGGEAAASRHAPAASTARSSDTGVGTTTTAPAATGGATCAANVSIVDRFAMWLLLASPDAGRSSPFVATVAPVDDDDGSHRSNDTSKNGATNNKKKLARFAMFLCVLCCLGLAEEFLWESLVWQDYTADWWEFDPSADFSRAAYSALTALLILPQATHYFLDAFLWRQSPAECNPALGVYMGVAGANPPAEWIDGR